MPEERLQKVLARAGVASRRKAERMILAGRVAVDGQVVRELGLKVDPATAKIAVDGATVELAPREYWILHKPMGVITTVDDPWGRPTARELVPTEGRVFPVGRLDANSSGLLIFTNDGDMAYRLTHPSFEHEKEYRVLVPDRPTSDQLRRLRRGVRLNGRRTAPAEVDVAEESDDGVWLRIVLREGRKRQIRRMLGTLDTAVLALVRVRIGPIEMGELSPGEARRLSPEERLELRELTGEDLEGSGSGPRRRVAAPDR